jgi:hypothetical protein
VPAFVPYQWPGGAGDEFSVGLFEKFEGVRPAGTVRITEGPYLATSLDLYWADGVTIRTDGDAALGFVAARHIRIISPLVLRGVLPIDSRIALKI